MSTRSWGQSAAYPLVAAVNLNYMHTSAELTEGNCLILALLPHAVRPRASLTRKNLDTKLDTSGVIMDVPASCVDANRIRSIAAHKCVDQES